MKKAILAFLTTVMTVFPSAGQSTLRQYIDEISGSEALGNSVWSVLAVRLNGDTLAAYNHTQRMVPASNVKLITTGAALHRLGPDFRYSTSLAYSGEVRDSTLVGDLYIIGNGDPTLGSKDECAIPLDSLFGRWKDLILQSGIRSISGTIIGDGRCMSCFGENYAWEYEDLGFSYGAAPVGLNFYENAQDFTVTPGEKEGAPVTIEPFFPQMPWVLFTNRSTTSGPGTGDGLYYINTGLGPYAEMRGHYAIDRNPRIEECSNRYPAYTCAWYFHQYLTANGINVGDAFADISPEGWVRQDPSMLESDRFAIARDSLHQIGETFSPKLIDIVRESLVRSDNFYAEAMLKTLGMMDKGCDAVDSCLAAESKVLASIGAGTSGIQLKDGSGLARTNYVSTAYFVRFLKAMAGTPEYKQYLRALPKPGQGTLAAKLPQAPAELRNRIHMKSGSMNGVRCLSGYVTPADGKTENTVVFSVMTNNVTASSQKINPVLDKLITLIAQ